MSTILLVEDDAVLRGGLSELFTREGYSIISAACAREAREKLSDNVNLIVLDVGLPDGDGVSLCQQWRSAGVAVPILFLTAKDEEFIDNPLRVFHGILVGPNSCCKRIATEVFKGSTLRLFKRVSFLFHCVYIGYIVVQKVDLV